MSEKKKATVNSGHSDKDILALEEKGYELFFDEVRFRDLKDETVGKLSHANAREYWMARGAHQALLKQKAREEKVGDLKILDPLGGTAANRLRALTKDPTQHICWKRPDELAGAEEAGYELVPNDDPGVSTPGATKTSTSRVLKRKDGTDDLVAMRLKPRDGLSPAQVYQQHLEAVSFESRKKAGSTFKDLREQLRAANRNIELIDTTSEETVSVSEEMARAAKEAGG